MFWHCFKYSFLTVIRDKNQIFWSLIFTIILGTLFYSTFHNAYEKSDMISNIKVSAYIEDEMVARNFSDIIEDISIDETNGEKLLNVTYCDSMEEAEKLLDNEDVVGMFYSSDGNLKLVVKDTGILESVLNTVVAQYHRIVTVMSDMSDKSKELQAAAMLSLLGEDNINVDRYNEDKSMNVYICYFYNLIAMSCLFACFSGTGFSVKNQANLSALGARKNVAGSNGFIQTVAGLAANWLILSVLTMISLFYLTLIGVDFGDKLLQIILIIFVGCMIGLSSGYFIGSIGKISESAKEAIAVAWSLTNCFLSGLMILDIRMYIEMHCPIINKINPAMMISDAFYALNNIGSDERFIKDIISMLACSVIFTILGVIFGRRKQYANL